MEAVKGKTVKVMKEKRKVPPRVTENLKRFTRIKKDILDAFEKEEEMTIDQLSKTLNIPVPEMLYFLMSLIKYGFVQVGTPDDKDEYFTYKIRK